MTLLPGTRVGDFEIESALGAGGMGEVYRARDTQLSRAVALKVLPELAAVDPERVARFEREAQTLAALNHPHIAQVYGIARTGGITSLVMELVDGEDLSQRIQAGPLAIAEATRIATQIAEALDAAHERGIVHRDLKPANIRIRQDGAVKVLDFGLAKALTPDPASAGNPSSATFASPAMTQIGVILGTAAYMAPEQAKGCAVDKRADIWAFGVILWEMLTGRPLFAYDSVVETIGAVVHRDVDWTALPASTPASVRILLRRCLQKDVAQRLRDIGDARLQLGDAGLDQPHADTEPPDPAPVQKWRVATVLPWAIAAVAVVAAAAATWTRPVDRASLPEVRFVVTPPTGAGALGNPVLAVDASLLVYQAERLYLRRLGEFSSVPLAGTEGAEWPFLSPDGQWVGFYADGRIKKVPVSGGEPLVITTVDGDTPGAAWGPGDRILFSPGWNGSPLAAVSSAGGAVTPVSTLDTAAGERGHWWPEFLPDGRHVLFTVWYAATGLTESKIAVLDLETGRHRVLFPGARPRYGAGHLFFYQAGGYRLVRFDPVTLATGGEPRAVLTDAEGLRPQGSSTNPAWFAASGAFAYIAGSTYPDVQMTWIRPDGVEEATPVRLRIHGSVDLSPDGRRIASGRPQGGTSQIWIADLESGAEERLQTSGLNFSPVWSPDGQRLAFISMRNGDFDTYEQALDGSGERALESAEIDETPEAWLPSGRGLITKNWLAEGSTALAILSLDGQRKTPVLTGPFQKEAIRVSPDGRWYAVVANASGAWRVHLGRIDGAGGLQQVPGSDVHRATAVRWAPSGDRIYFVRRGALVAAALEDRDGRLTVRQPTVIARVPEQSLLAGVSRDGQRVLIAKAVGADVAEASGIHIILGFPGLR